jgi:hypothetical protein
VKAREEVDDAPRGRVSMEDRKAGREVGKVSAPVRPQRWRHRSGIFFGNEAL